MYSPRPAQCISEAQTKLTSSTQWVVGTSSIAEAVVVVLVVVVGIGPVRGTAGRLVLPLRAKHIMAFFVQALNLAKDLDLLLHLFRFLSKLRRLATGDCLYAGRLGLMVVDCVSFSNVSQSTRGCGRGETGLPNSLSTYRAFCNLCSSMASNLKSSARSDSRVPLSVQASVTAKPGSLLSFF